MRSDKAIVVAALFGLVAVAAGAFGAHALRDQIDAHALEIWNTGARYQLVHAVVMLALALDGVRGPSSRARAGALAAFAVGMAIFAGTLYALALGGPRGSAPSRLWAASRSWSDGP